MFLLSFFIQRLIEPSSYAGLGLLGSGAHSLVTGNIAGGISQVAGGVLAFLMPEGVTTPPAAASTSPAK
jgi:hypothetical protein